MRKSLLLAMMVLVTAANTPAASAPAAEPEAGAAPDKPKLICRTDRTTGSLARRIRTCKTAEQWNAQARASQQALDRYVRDTPNNLAVSSASNPSPAGAP